MPAIADRRMDRAERDNKFTTTTPHKLDNTSISPKTKETKYPTQLTDGNFDTDIIGRFFHDKAKQ